MASNYSTDAVPPESLRYNNKEIRIVMLGKTGAGKSAAGNTILGKQEFESEFSLESLTTECKKAFSELDGQKVAVIDTPGLFDTRTDEEQTVKNIAQFISLASPGPHVFLIVIKLDKHTEEEQKTVQKIQEMFGEDADKYSMVLFTYGDQLKGKPVEEVLEKCAKLKELVAKCNSQYHVFNNEVNDRSQVRELLNKIRKITEKNGGSHYTTEMFQKAERKIEEEKQRILREKEEENQQQLERLRREIEEKYEQKMRAAITDIERTNLREACEREIQEVITNWMDNLETLARQAAEKSPTVITYLITIVVPLVLSLALKYIRFKS